MRKLLLLLCLSSLAFSQTPIIHSGSPIPGTDINAPAINQVRYATDFQFTQSPGGTLSIGSNTITISAVRGINTWSAPPGNSSFHENHYLRIAGTGTPESVLLTATTCIGASTGTCTVSFTAVGAHSVGYTISTATGGFQEAIDDCIVTPPAYNTGPNPQNGCTITGGPVATTLATAATYTFYAPLGIDYPPGAPGPLTVDGQGSTVQCSTLGQNCFAIGPNAAGNHPVGVTVKNFAITNVIGSGHTDNGTTRAVYDSGQGSVIFNNSFPNATVTDVFDYLIYVDNDQKVTISHNFVNTAVGPAVRCTSAWCGVAVYGSGLNSGALGSIIDNDLTMECRGNAIQWVSGNGVTIQGNIIQDWNQYGLEYGPGLQDMTDAGGNYFENGSCTNPDIGLAGYNGNAIAYWGNTKFQQSAIDHGGGVSPLFSNTGATIYDYYVVGNKSGNQTPPFFIGYAITNGSTSFTGYYPKFNATTYDILRSGPLLLAGNDAAPYGTGNWAISTGNSCSSNPCSFTESFTPPTSYVVHPAYTPSFTDMPYWPGAATYMGHANSSAPVIYDGYFPASGALVANSLSGNGTLYQAHFRLGASLAPGYFQSGIVAANDSPQQTSAVLGNGETGSIITQVGNGNTLHLQTGLYNAGLNAGTSNESLIFQTYDADSAKTLATGGHQRTLESGDAGIGYDAGPTHMGLQAADFSFYAGHIMDNSSYVGRVNSSGWTLNNLTVLGTCTNCSNNGLQFIFGNAGPAITALTIPNGDSLTFSGTGTNNASSINGVIVTGTPSIGWVPTATSGTTATWQATGSGTAFSAITASTNTTAAMVLGTGSSLTVSGSGTNNATTLLANTWAIPGTIGSTTPNTGAFTMLSASSTVSGAGFSAYLASPPAIGGSAAAAGTFTTLLASTSITDSALTPGNCVQASTGGLLVTTGGACGAGGGGVSSVYGSTGTITALTIPSGDSLDVSGTGTNNATTLLAGTWAIPGTIGSSTPNTGAFTTLSASSTVSGTGFSTYLASPPAIGGSTPAAGSFTALTGTNVTDSALTSGRCVQTSTGGLLTTTSGACATGGGLTSLFGNTGPTITALVVPNGDSLGVSGTGTIDATTLLAGTWAIPGTIGSTTKNTGAFTTLLASTSITDSALTSGNCVQAGTAGLLTTTAGPCGAGGGGVSSVFGSTGTITALTIPSGDSLTVSGTGTNNATSINGITITGTPATGNVPTATSSSAATWQAPAGAPWFNVVTFGAVGNGSTPDQVAIQAAMTACGAAGGGTVLFPGNTYLIGAQLNFSQNNCGLYSFNHEGILKKGFNGDIVSVTGTNQSIHGLTLDDQGASFTGRDINASGATQIFLEFNVIKNQANSTYFTGVTGATITHNWITSGTAGGGIFFEKNSTRFRITDNYIDVSPYTGGNAKDITGHATTAGQSLSDVVIANNMLIGPSGTGTFNVEIGGFNGNMADHITITGNVMRETIGADGAISLDSTNHFTIAGNTIYNVGADLSIGCIEIVGSNYGSVVGTTCHNGGFKGGIICNTCNFVGFDNNIIDGFSPTGGDQAFFGPSTSKAGVGISTATESGNTITIVASGALPSELYPGQVVFLSGVTLNTPVQGEYKGYNGLCTDVLTVNLGTNTITCTWPISGLGSSSGGNIGWSASHNSFSNNKVIFPTGATTGTLRGWWSQCNVASATCSNNTWNGNHVWGTLQATQNGVQLERDSGTLDSDLFIGNQFENLTNGIVAGTGSTNVSVEEEVVTGVTTPLNASSGTIVESDLPLTFGSLAACAAGLEGNTAPVTDDNTALAWNATITGGGSSHVHAYCNASAWVMQ